MIHYCVARDHRYTIDLFAKYARGQLDGTVAVKLYGTGNLFALPDGTGPEIFVFTDLDRLAVPSVLARRWNEFEASNPRVACLNHPARTFVRFELLRSLYLMRINRYNVYAAVDADMPMQFPVFVRSRGGHQGALSGLLHNADDVRATVAGLLREWSMQELMIIEYRHTAGADGVFRKYSAFRIGNRIVPHHVQFAREWMVKRSALTDESYQREELAYVRNAEPHEALLRRIFDLAGIGYGRIDYALDEQGVQVWEINTNPMIVGEETPVGLRQQVRDHVAANLVSAFKELAAGSAAQWRI